MARKRKRRILLIDDDVSLLVTLRDFLRFEGYDVLTADSGEQGIEALKEYEPDLIVLDMSMPGIGGLGFLKEIRGPEGKPRFPVLVLTARSGMAEYFGSIPVDGFVAKPCDPQDLLMEVGRIVFLRGDDAETDDSSEAGKHVLVGENRPDVSRRLVEWLEAEGLRVSVAATGPELIERAIIDPPHLILLKLIFGNMNGDTLAGILAEMPKTAHIPVILYDDSGTRLSVDDYAIKSGTVKKIVKGSDARELVDAVRQAVGKAE